MLRNSVPPKIVVRLGGVLQPGCVVCRVSCVVVGWGWVEFERRLRRYRVNSLDCVYSELHQKR